MSGTYAKDWKPRNLGGQVYYDPRQELTYWADSVPDGQQMVAVPCSTLRAAAAVRECSASITVYNDDEGPLPSPVDIYCRKPSGHDHSHHNGYIGWSQ